jgi:uncharacterized membrane protein YdfJ with MMPL/SSD domain
LASGRPDADVVVVYQAPASTTVHDPVVAEAVLRRLNALPPDAVASRVTFWETRSPAMVDVDGRYALATITLAGADEAQRAANYRRIADQFTVDGVTTQVGGKTPMGHATGTRSKSDLTTAEAISLPIVLLLLILILGGVVAAALPVLVGGLAVLGSLCLLNAISHGVDVNNFAINVATLLGLGLAIDYGLFSVGRFREELARGNTVESAVRTTMATAGHTIAFSATLLMVALGGLLVFPMDFLRSMAYGGMSAVAVAAFISLTLLPALLGTLGHRVDALALPWRRARDRRSTVDHGESRVLARLADAVMRRPVAFALPIVIGLLVLAAPLAALRFGAMTEKQLPQGDPTRQAIETINTNFPAAGNNTAKIVLHGRDGNAPDDATVAEFAEAVDDVPGVDDAVVTGTAGDTVLLGAQLYGDPLGDIALDAVGALRALPAPGGVEVFVGGFTATVIDSNSSIVDRLPLMIALLVGATLVLMFLAFRSVLLPIKAVLMSALSLSATYGVLVWIFQLGHGAALLNVTPEPLQAGMFVLIGAVVFGLSTDYETFLLSRMVEARRAGMSTRDAVHTGLIRTGRMISAAAMLLIVVTGAFGLSSISMMRFVGVGMIVALIVDATVVRMLLVPAVLRVLGAVTWLPGWRRGRGTPAGWREKSGQRAQRDGAPELERVPVINRD